MTPATKAASAGEAAGDPEQDRLSGQVADYSKLKIVRGARWATLCAPRNSSAGRDLAKIGKPVDPPSGA